jgi:hypothetical protein
MLVKAPEEPEYLQWLAAETRDRSGTGKIIFSALRRRERHVSAVNLIADSVKRCGRSFMLVKAPEEPEYLQWLAAETRTLHEPAAPLHGVQTAVPPPANRPPRPERYWQNYLQRVAPARASREGWRLKLVRCTNLPHRFTESAMRLTALT